jgi:hypothetical protein
VNLSSSATCRCFSQDLIEITVMGDEVFCPPVAFWRTSSSLVSVSRALGCCCTVKVSNVFRRNDVTNEFPSAICHERTNNEWTAGLSRCFILHNGRATMEV